MKHMVLIAALALAACGGKKAAPVTSNTQPATGSAATAEDECCCLDKSDNNMGPPMPKAECATKGGTCSTEPDCFAVTGEDIEAGQGNP